MKNIVRTLAVATLLSGTLGTNAAAQYLHPR